MPGTEIRSTNGSNCGGGFDIKPSFPQQGCLWPSQESPASQSGRDSGVLTGRSQILPPKVFDRWERDGISRPTTEQ